MLKAFLSLFAAPSAFVLSKADGGKETSAAFKGAGWCKCNLWLFYLMQ